LVEAVADEPFADGSSATVEPSAYLVAASTNTAAAESSADGSSASAVSSTSVLCSLLSSSVFEGVTIAGKRAAVDN
jgi:hypothetical protein